MATSSDKARGDKSLRKDYSEGAWQLMVAAEKLFGRHGIEAVSLREIAATANHANNSAVQYHFGSKENLVQAVFEMRMPKLEAARAQHLANARSMGKLSLRALLCALLLPVLEVFDDQALENYVLFNTRLTHRDTGDHPFFRAAAISPASIEIYDEIQKLFSQMPKEAFSIRMRLASDLFLDSVAEWKRLKTVKVNPYRDDQVFWDDVINMALAIMQTPLAAQKKK